MCRQVSFSFAYEFFVLGVSSIIELHVSGTVSCGSGNILLDLSVLDHEQQHAAFKLSELNSFTGLIFRSV